MKLTCCSFRFLLFLLLAHCVARLTMRPLSHSNTCTLSGQRPLQPTTIWSH
ncbi:hypothetical protein PF005_g15103 [Phytophthora fragariae]|uniref:RxLR effector protein n=1 Tax=Phytophthora fragariae TaxID=53985 RepID=A0A6A3YF80_9STRA|nr:hypothetical protein PF009_g16402 [Phytophthora fragariae]KAE9000779.1 hypothetical protein PF011_g14040 [Phytophthora fragariae]KAE9099766.1 hypothetical protein PF007_g15753 [Phytophthora fragariae]KAE9136130.1 hypothetical protein PF006_g14459 [Phytophthora fragariae]KAE9201060.1 hypothetical protein PF005_g15103 [Phytophthora fragariae]